MKITIDKDLVELTPENEHETTNLETLWRLVIDCAGFNKKLEPIGEYIPQKNTCARFVIEGMRSDVMHDSPDPRADKDGSYYCKQCNKYINLKKNERIPLCCGKIMEILD